MDYEHKSLLDAPLEEAFAYHDRPGSFERLLPPWLPLRVVARSGGAKDGRVSMRVGYGPASFGCQVERFGYEAGRLLKDRSASGPFRWEHSSEFSPSGERHTNIHDRVSYLVPKMLAGSATRHLARIFSYRHAVTQNDLEFFRERPTSRPLHVAMTGATGFVGSSLSAFLGVAGHHVLPLSRPGRPRHAGGASWDPASGRIEPRPERLDAIVHLAGENVFGRFGETKMRKIRESRVSATAALCREIATWPEKPKVLVAASAIGYYGDRGTEILHEESSAGTGFLAETCKEWEDAVRPLAEAGCRVVNVRIGIVLSPRGGALATMLPAFRAGVGGWLGKGSQFFSWISMDDLLRVFYAALIDEGISGPVNATGPLPVSNYVFTKTLARLLHRPAILPVPAPALRLALGRFADEGLLASARVIPAKLEKLGFRFLHSEVDEALRHVLGLYIRPSNAGSAIPV